MLIATLALAAQLTNKTVESILNSALNPKREIVVSFRWNSFEQQFHHFIYGAALAYALNASFSLDMSLYPINMPQPPFLLKFKRPVTQTIGRNFSGFRRLRVARETYCSDIDTSRPLLIRNYEQIYSLYSNHKIATRLRSMFGMDAAFHIAHSYLDVKDPQEDGSIFIEASAMEARKMKNIASPEKIAQTVANTIKQLNTTGKRIIIYTNKKTVQSSISRVVKSAKFVNSINSINGAMTAETFVGTFRSQLANAINLIRGKSGYLMDTETQTVIKQRVYTAGILSPFKQDVEDTDVTINERLRPCADNYADLRGVISTFSL